MRHPCIMLRSPAQKIGAFMGDEWRPCNTVHRARMQKGSGMTSPPSGGKIKWLIQEEVCGWHENRGGRASPPEACREPAVAEEGRLFGAYGLEDKDLVLIKSTLKLRAEKWLWTAEPERAALLFVDAQHPAAAAVPAPGRGTRYVLVGRAGMSCPGLEGVGRPLKAVSLLRALDRLLATEPASPTSPVAATGPVSEAQAGPEPVHPWQGVRLMLLRAPSYSKYPVTAEMLGPLEALCRAPVSYSRLVASLPLDRPLLDAILNDAARDGFLVDEHGTPLPPSKEKRSGLLGRLLRRP